MKITKLNWVLLAMTVMLGLIVSLGDSPESSAGADDRAFEAFDASAILRVAIRDMRNEDAVPLVLVREMADQPWRVEARSMFPAEAYPLEALLARIGNLRERDQVAEDSDSLALFDLAPGMGTGVELSSPGGVPWRFVMGLPGGQAGGFLRSESESRIFSVPGFVGLSTAPRQWIAPRVFDFDATAVSRIEIQLAGVKLNLGRDDKGIWRELETQLVAPRVTAEDLVGDLAALVLLDLAPGELTPEEAGFGPGLPRVRLVDADGERLAELAIGGVSELGPRFVKAGSWREEGHADWTGLVAAPLAASVMRRVSTIIEALGQQ